MSRQINQPINQVRLTNVAVVRMNKGGKRFEIACYRNKVMDYRKGLETDLSEVLQTDRIFTNVSKGQFAKHSDLVKVFQTKDEEAIARIILTKGQLQVGDLERQSQLENTLAQIATWVANHCVHPQSQRPYTVSQIKHALGKQYQVQPHKPIKKQYLDCVKFLKGVIPIERAKMELALSWNNSSDNNNATTPATTYLEQLDKVLRSASEESILVETKIINDTTRCILRTDPSLYRALDDLAKTLPEGKLELLNQVVTQEGDIDLEMEIERKAQLQQSQQQSQHQSQQKSNATKEEEEESSTEEDDHVQWIQKTTANGTANSHDEEEDENEDDDGAEQPQEPEATKQDNSDDDDDDEEEEEPKPSIQAFIPRAEDDDDEPKKTKKLSKKAKRRQRELEMEREARQRAEQERQEERARVEGKIQPVVEANAAAQQQDSAKACNTCGGSFPTAAAYRAHFKTDWHRFNQKLKLQGVPPVSEQEFILCDAESFFGGP